MGGGGEARILVLDIRLTMEDMSFFTSRQSSRLRSRIPGERQIPNSIFSPKAFSAEMADSGATAMQIATQNSSNIRGHAPLTLLRGSA